MTHSRTTPTVAFFTVGCPKNEVDTDRMRACVNASSYAVTDDVAQADVVVVNTCSFIQAATEESIAAVLEFAGGDQRVVVAGCMPSRYGAELAEALPEAAATLPVADEASILDVLEQVTGIAPHAGTAPAATRTVSGPSAYLQVSDGCHRSCSYCTIPSIRGPYRSRMLPDIIDEALELVALGAQEIVLIGQDITAWGHDLAGNETLADVVRAVSAVPGVDWLRLMYAQPDGVSEELLRAMADCPNVVRYLDMPLQHASKPVLRAMRRSGDDITYLRHIARIREALPGVVLRTTLIAGFPGETRGDASRLSRFLEAARFDYVGVFPYSREDGTDAALMEDQIPRRTALARAQRLRDLSDTIGWETAAEQVGRELEVLVEGIDPDEDVVVGRWRGQAPEIDGVVYLDRGEAGQMVRVRIEDSAGYDLEGVVIG